MYMKLAIRDRRNPSRSHHPTKNPIFRVLGWVVSRPTKGRRKVFTFGRHYLWIGYTGRYAFPPHASIRLDKFRVTE